MAPSAIIPDVANESMKPLVAMRKGGDDCYNKNSHAQAHASTKALPLLPEFPQAKRIHIADYGCSQGVNSLIPITTVLDTLPSGSRARISFVDTPMNDWTTLGRTYSAAAPRLSRGGDIELEVEQVHRSFFEQVLPSESCDLGWAACSFHYLIHKPAPVDMAILEAGINKKFFQSRRLANAAASFDSLVTLLRLRALETKRGGSFIMVGVGYTSLVDDLRCTNEPFMRVVQSWRKEGRINDEQASEMLRYQYLSYNAAEVSAAVQEIPEWEINECFEETILHPASAQLLESKRNSSSWTPEQSLQASRSYAETIVKWHLAVHAAYVHKAVQLGKGSKDGFDSRTQEANRMVEEMEKRMIEDIIQNYRDERLEHPIVYMKLTRRM